MIFETTFKALAVAALLTMTACSFHKMPPLTSAEGWQSAQMQKQQMSAQQK
ncbi:MAG: hypothetical protein AB7G39_09835 [Alphaproteobacteria bacterium]